MHTQWTTWEIFCNNYIVVPLSPVQILLNILKTDQTPLVHFWGWDTGVLCVFKSWSMVYLAIAEVCFHLRMDIIVAWILYGKKFVLLFTIWGHLFQCGLK